MSGIAEIRLASGNTDEAVRLWQRAVEIAPRDAVLQLNLGAALGNGLEQWEQAIEHFRQAVKFAPTVVEARNNLGLALVNTGRIGEGRLELERALRLDGENVDALGFMAYALMQQQQYDAAIEFLQKAVRIAPNSYVSHERLAVAYEQAGRFDGAINQLQRAAELADRQQRPDLGRLFRGRIEALDAKRTRP